MEPGEVTSQIRDTFFDFHHLRTRQVALSEAESGLLWEALEELSRLGEPEFYDTVEIEDEPWLLVEIAGAAHLVHVEDDTVETRSVGSLNGGTYFERVTMKGEDRALVGVFRHEGRLPGPIDIKINRWRDRPHFEGLRAACRRWASASAD
jgi:hypothetical protein